MANPKSSAGYRLGIVNPLTLAGTEISSILREHSFPYAKLSLLDSTGDAEGALTEVAEEAAVVKPIAQEGLEGLDLVFFCGPSEKNQEWIARHQEDGFIAVDLSYPSHADEGRLTVAGLNLDDLRADERHLVSPHPAAIPLALILDTMGKVAPVEACTASVVKPASEFGQEGVEELAHQTISVLNVQPVTKSIFDRQLAFNLYPAAAGEEELIVGEVRTLTGARGDLALFITQGTIFHSYTFTIFAKFRDEIEIERLRQAVAANPAFAFAEGDQQFGTIDAAGRDEVLIAEIRADANVRGGVWIWASCDNLRRSAALNAVLIAEKALPGLEVAN